MLTQSWRYRLLLALAAMAACSTYSPASRADLEPRRDIRADFTSPSTFQLACDSLAKGADATSTCVPHVQEVSGIVSLNGRAERVDGDSLLVSVATLVDSAGHVLRYTPPRTTWLHSSTANLQYRHKSAGKTVLAVVGPLAAIAVLVAAIAFANPPKVF